jgi:hypothetical protein
MAQSAERLFETYFAPFYPEEALADLSRLRATDANPAENPSILAQLEGAAQTFARLGPEAFDEPSLALDFSDASVHRLSALITRARRDAWLATRGDDPAPLVQIVTHGALYVGACVVKNHGGRWLVRRPTWESLVRLRSAAGVADLAPFSWWLKALSDDEIDKGRLADRYRTHVEVPTFDAGALPPLADPERSIPALTKVRYDTLYKHLRAHLPELRSVGDDFPSAERFAAYAFKRLDFRLLGAGRMLLIYGANQDGVHFFWLDAAGFVKAAYFRCDAFPDPIVELRGETIRVVARSEGREALHEMLWWGP